MKQPKGFIKEREEHLVCKLNKEIYGLKQSLKCWNTALGAHLKQIGFVQSASDPCLYYKDAGGDIFYIGVYVDNIILARSTHDQVNEVKAALSKIRYQRPRNTTSFPGNDSQTRREKTLCVDRPTDLHKKLVKEVWNAGLQPC